MDAQGLITDFYEFKMMKPFHEYSYKDHKYI